MSEKIEIEAGDIVRLKCDNEFFNGAVALVDEVKEWGALVLIPLEAGEAYYRAPWEEMEKADDIAVLKFVKLDPDATIDMLGYLPEFINPTDKRGAVEQFNDAYQGGWSDMPGFTFDAKDKTLHYPEDPVYRPLFMTQMHEETIIFYQYGITLVVQKDGSYRAARLD